MRPASSPRPAPTWFVGSARSSLFACVYVPEFPAQALLRLRPPLHRKPVAVLRGAPPQEQVCAGNARARRDGLRNGMTRVEAESLDGITVLPRSEREEDAARRALMGSVRHFTPMAEFLSADTSAMCVLDIAGMARLYSDPHSLATALRAALLGRGLHASIAVSANFHTACSLAQGKPGITVAAPGDEAKALAPLMLGVLRLTEEESQTLALWGIRTLGALAALPGRELIARMGQRGNHLRELARGEHPHLFAPTPLPREFREQFSFDAPVRQLEAILFVVSPMLDQLLAQAGTCALSLAAVTVTFTLDGAALDSEEDGRAETIADTAMRGRDVRERFGAGHRTHSESAAETAAETAANRQSATAPTLIEQDAADSSRRHPRVFQRTIRPTLPTGSKHLLLKLLQLDLAAHPPLSAVLAITLEAEAAQTGAVQGGLFAPPLPEPSRLDVTLARLQALVGEGRVGSPVPRDTHMPDSFTMQAFRIEATPVLRSITGGKSVPALRLLRPPEPVHVAIEGVQPVSFRFRGELFRVHKACGPWRLNGAWWSGEAWGYECWDVAAERSHNRASALPAQRFTEAALQPFLIPASAPAPRLCCRLQRNLENRQWCVEGVYD